MDQIGKLMAVFDAVGSTFREVDLYGGTCEWHPCSDVEKATFNALTDQANREALKEWYLELRSLNPLASAFKQILERAIGEELPLGNGSK